MKLLKQLINLNGVSGNEHDVREFIIKESKKYLKNIRVDNMGNVVAIKKGVRPRIMFLAHMDEIGLMVRTIDKYGKVSMSTIGGIDPAVLLAQRVYIDGKKRVGGVITTDWILNDSENAPKKLQIEDLYIYTGLAKRELEKKGVEIGNYINFSEACNYCTLGSENIIGGKALDDRMGCFVLLELMRTMKTKNEINFVFTVQEEIGLYGAKASIFGLEPDYAIAVDVSGHDDEKGRVLIGKGPTLTIKDAEMIGNKNLNEYLEKIAKKLKIPMQREVSDVGTTDATSIFAARGGVPSSVLGVSVANVHTTTGVAHKKDIEGAVKILAQFLKNPPPIKMV